MCFEFRQKIISMPYLTTNSTKCWYLNGKHFQIKLNVLKGSAYSIYLFLLCVRKCESANQLRLFRFAKRADLNMHPSNEYPKLTWLGAWSCCFSLFFLFTPHVVLVSFVSVAFHATILKFMSFVADLFDETVVIFKLLCSLWYTRVLEWRIKQTQSNNPKKKPHDLSYLKYMSV